MPPFYGITYLQVKNSGHHFGGHSSLCSFVRQVIADVVGKVQSKEYGQDDAGNQYSGDVQITGYLGQPAHLLVRFASSTAWK